MNFNFRNYINEIAHFLNENTEDELPPTTEEEDPQNSGVDNSQGGADPSAPPPTPTEDEAAAPVADEVPQDDGAQGEGDGANPESVNQDEIAGAREKSASFFKAFSDLQGMYNNLKEILKSTSFGEDLDKVREAALQQEKTGGDTKPPANPPQQ